MTRAMNCPTPVFLALAIATLTHALFCEASITAVDVSAATITYSTSHASYPGTKAFDGDWTSSSGRWLSGAAGDAWVCADFSSSASRPAVNAYAVMGLTGTYFAERAPKSFVIEASHSGVDGDWVVLDHRSAQTCWAESERRFFVFTNSTQYAFWRFRITENNGWNQPATHTGIGELLLYSVADAPEAAPLTTYPANGATDVADIAVLTWTPRSDNAAYRVWLGTSPTLGEDDLLAETGTETAVADGLVPGSTYYWRVDAFNEFGTKTGAISTFTARATDSELYCHDGFEEYPVGESVRFREGGMGWSGQWGCQNSTAAIVVDKRMPYQNGNVYVRSGTNALSLGPASTDPTAKRDFPDLDKKTVYMSFLVRTEAVHTSGTRLFCACLQSKAASNFGRIGLSFQHPNNLFGIQADTATVAARVNTPDVVLPAHTYFIVFRFTRQVHGALAPYSLCEMLIDPDTAKEPQSGWASTAVNSGNDTLGRFVTRVLNNVNSGISDQPHFLDEIRLGPTFESVVPRARQPFIMMLK